MFVGVIESEVHGVGEGSTGECGVGRLVEIMLKPGGSNPTALFSIDRFVGKLFDQITILRRWYQLEKAWG